MQIIIVVLNIERDLGLQMFIKQQAQKYARDKLSMNELIVW